MRLLRGPHGRSQRLPRHCPRRSTSLCYDFACVVSLVSLLIYIKHAALRSHRHSLSYPTHDIAMRPPSSGAMRRDVRCGRALRVRQCIVQRHARRLRGGAGQARRTPPADHGARTIQLATRCVIFVTRLILRAIKDAVPALTNTCLCGMAGCPTGYVEMHMASGVAAAVHPVGLSGNLTIDASGWVDRVHSMYVSQKRVHATTRPCSMTLD